MRNLLTFRKYFIWPSNWFCDYHYHRLLSHDLKMQYYLQSVFYRLQLPTSQYIITRYNNKTFIEFTFYIDNALRDNKKMLFYMKSNRYLLWSNNCFSVNSYQIYKKITQLLFTMIFDKNKLNDITLQFMYIIPSNINMHNERQLRVIWFLKYINLMYAKIHTMGIALSAMRSKYYVTSRSKLTKNTLDSNQVQYKEKLCLNKRTKTSLADKAYNFNMLYNDKLKTLYKLYTNNVAVSMDNVYRETFIHGILNLNNILQVSNIQTRTKRTKTEINVKAIEINNAFFKCMDNLYKSLHFINVVKAIKQYRCNNSYYIYRSNRYKNVKFNINKMLNYGNNVVLNVYSNTAYKETTLSQSYISPVALLKTRRYSTDELKVLESEGNKSYLVAKKIIEDQIESAKNAIKTIRGKKKKIKIKKRVKYRLLLPVKKEHKLLNYIRVITYKLNTVHRTNKRRNKMHVILGSMANIYLKNVLKDSKYIKASIYNKYNYMKYFDNVTYTYKQFYDIKPAINTYIYNYSTDFKPFIPLYYSSKATINTYKVLSTILEHNSVKSNCLEVIRNVNLYSDKIKLLDNITSLKNTLHDITLQIHGLNRLILSECTIGKALNNVFYNKGRNHLFELERIIKLFNSNVDKKVYIAPIYNALTYHIVALKKTLRYKTYVNSNRMGTTSQYKYIRGKKYLPLHIYKKRQFNKTLISPFYMFNNTFFTTYSMLSICKMFSNKQRYLFVNEHNILLKMKTRTNFYTINVIHIINYYLYNNINNDVVSAWFLYIRKIDLIFFKNIYHKLIKVIDNKILNNAVTEKRTKTYNAVIKYTYTFKTQFSILWYKYLIGHRLVYTYIKYLSLIVNDTKVVTFNIKNKHVITNRQIIYNYMEKKNILQSIENKLCLWGTLDNFINTFSKLLYTRDKKKVFSHKGINFLGKHYSTINNRVCINNIQLYYLNNKLQNSNIAVSTNVLSYLDIVNDYIEVYLKNKVYNVYVVKDDIKLQMLMYNNVNTERTGQFFNNKKATYTTLLSSDSNIDNKVQLKQAKIKQEASNIKIYELDTEYIHSEYKKHTIMNGYKHIQFFHKYEMQVLRDLNISQRVRYYKFKINLNNVYNKFGNITNWTWLNYYTIPIEFHYNKEHAHNYIKKTSVFNVLDTFSYRWYKSKPFSHEWIAPTSNKDGRYVRGHIQTNDKQEVYINTAKATVTSKARELYYTGKKTSIVSQYNMFIKKHFAFLSNNTIQLEKIRLYINQYIELKGLRIDDKVINKYYYFLFNRINISNTHIYNINRTLHGYKRILAIISVVINSTIYSYLSYYRSILIYTNNFSLCNVQVSKLKVTTAAIVTSELCKLYTVYNSIYTCTDIGTVLAKRHGNVKDIESLKFYQINYLFRKTIYHNLNNKLIDSLFLSREHTRMSTFESILKHNKYSNRVLKSEGKINVSVRMPLKMNSDLFMIYSFSSYNGQINYMYNHWYSNVILNNIFNKLIFINKYLFISLLSKYYFMIKYNKNNYLKYTLVINNLFYLVSGIDKLTVENKMYHILKHLRRLYTIHIRNTYKNNYIEDIISTAMAVDKGRQTLSIQLLTLKYRYFFHLLENTIDAYCNTNTFLILNYNLKNDYVINSAKLWCDQIRLLLKKRMHIKKVFNYIKKQQYKEIVVREQAVKNNNNASHILANKYPLQGIRLIYYGNLKKGKRKQKIYYHLWVSDIKLYGALSCNTFKRYIDFYKHSVPLRNATVGIKLWLLFHIDNL